MSKLHDALFGPPVTEVPLSPSPLVRVIGQVRFPPILAISNPEQAAKFQEHVRPQYPLLESSIPVPHVKIDPNTGVPSVETAKVWSFFDAKKEWRVSLTNDFIALDTQAYISRTDFVDRFDFIINSLYKSFAPQISSRVGLRYINVIKKPIVDDISTLLTPEIVGLHTHKEISDNTIHSITDTVLRAANGLVRIRSGSLSAGITVDPDNIIPPKDGSAYWIIDIDMSNENEQAFDREALRTQIWGYAEREYALFRWMVNPKFLAIHGAKNV